MCDRCIAIDTELRKLERLRTAVDDELALALIALEVKDLVSEKTALHLNGPPKSATDVREEGN